VLPLDKVTTITMRPSDPRATLVSHDDVAVDQSDHGVHGRPAGRVILQALQSYSPELHACTNATNGVRLLLRCVVCM